MTTPLFGYLQTNLIKYKQNNYVFLVQSILYRYEKNLSTENYLNSLEGL